MTTKELLDHINKLLQEEKINEDSEVFVSYDNGFFGSVKEVNYYLDGTLRIVL